VHKKTEQGHCGPNETPPFIFTWELKLKFDRDMKELKEVEFAITDWINCEDSDLKDITIRNGAINQWKKRTYIPPQNVLITAWEAQLEDPSSAFDGLYAIMGSINVSPVYFRGEVSSMVQPTLIEKDVFDEILCRLKAPEKVEQVSIPLHVEFEDSSPQTNTTATRTGGPKPITRALSAENPSSVPLERSATPLTRTTSADAPPVSVLQPKGQPLSLTGSGPKPQPQFHKTPNQGSPIQPFVLSFPSDPPVATKPLDSSDSSSPLGAKKPLPPPKPQPKPPQKQGP